MPTIEAEMKDIIELIDQVDKLIKRFDNLDTMVKVKTTTNQATFNVEMKEKQRARLEPELA